MPLSISQALLRACFSVLATCLLAFALSEANQPFTPESPFAFAESWRWHELEPLNEFQLYDVAETLEGELCFTSEKGLVFYDGYRCRLSPYPRQEAEFSPYKLFCSQNGLIYLYTSFGLYSFKDGEWTLQKPFSKAPREIRPLIVRSAQGVEVFALPDGFYRLVGRSLQAIPEIKEETNEICFDSQNRLWIKIPYGNQIARYQFSSDGLSRPIDRKVYTINTDEDAFLHLVGSPQNDTVLATSWKHSVPPHKFSETQDEWLPIDFQGIVGNNQHADGFHINAKETALISKTGMVVIRDGEATPIEYPDFNVPTNLPFALVRQNGNVVLGGYGEKAYEIEYSDVGYDSYQALHFQCDSDERSRWFVSVGGAIIENDPYRDTWTKHTENVIDTPLTIISSDDGYVWASGSHQGTAAVCYYDGERWVRNLHPELSSFISHLSSFKSSNGDLLFGSGDDEAHNLLKGLALYRKSGDTYQYHLVQSPVTTDRPVGFAEIEPGKYWTGGVGLHSFETNPETAFEGIPPFKDERWIDHLASDGNGNTWVAIWDRGFFRYDGSEFEQINAPSQISSNQVIYIHPDRFETDKLWVATNKGISHYNGEHWFADALPKELRFSREGGTIRQSNDGAIWVNIGKRDWYFRRSLKFNLTKELYDAFRTIRYLPETDAPTVTIRAHETEATSPANIFIQWDGTDKWSRTPKEKLKYSYRIDQGEWSPFRNKTNTVVLDVPAGKHHFEVRAIDSNGNVSERSASTIFTVIPPTWQRPWFIALTLAATLTIIALIALLIRQRIQHILQMDEFKLQFFTNISHELRTPLTVILGPIESQLEKLPQNWDKRPLQLAYRNAKKTLNLINQILDFRQAETSKLELHPSHSDIIQVANETINLIRPLADAQSQSLDFHHSESEHYAWFDSEKFERVLNNLVNNAIKYTPEKGRISVSLEIGSDATPNIATLIVKDNGCGIPSGKIDSIFEVFYRAGNVARHKVRGSGIGLAYTKSIVEAFGGKISVESPVTKIDGADRGACFTVTLPLMDPPTGQAKTPSESEDEESVTAPPAKREDNERPLVLLSEDDSDILEFLESELSGDYETLSTKDGEEAFAKACERIPDLILTDVMMPKLDGHQLCRKLKENPSTCHIPVIMLTALKSDRHELEGLDCGADDFLSKPIRPRILKKRIHNQLESRQKLRALFQKQKQSSKIEPKKVATNALDEKFLTKALNTVEAHLENPLFDVEFFASEMAMSRMSLYRKFKAITGETPSAYVRSIRMKIASDLLLSGEHNVTEIAFRVGFNDLSYFSTTFKKHFGKSPSEFVKSARSSVASEE